MIKQRRYTRTLAFVCLGLFGTTSMLAFGIENAQSVFVTQGYQHQMRTLGMMNKIDANGDHMVSREEFDDYYGKLFDALDRDHDGTLDAKEWVGAAHNKEAVSLSSGGYARDLASMKMMHAIDTDGDHTVSKDEFLKAHEAMFAKMNEGESGPVDAKHWLATYFPK